MQNSNSLKIIAICVVLISIIGCGNEQTNHSESFCLDQALICPAENEATAQLALQQSLQFELPITFQLTLPNGFTLVTSQAKLVGLNMAMGQIPVALQPVVTTANGYQGQLIVVACSNPDMIWQLQVEAKKPQGEPILLQWSFSTQHME